jgi:hypothetical protein
MAIRREGDSPDHEQARQVQNVVNLLGGKIEIVEGKVSRSTREGRGLILFLLLSLLLSFFFFFLSGRGERRRGEPFLFGRIETAPGRIRSPPRLPEHLRTPQTYGGSITARSFRRPRPC